MDGFTSHSPADSALPLHGIPGCGISERACCPEAVGADRTGGALVWSIVGTLAAGFVGATRGLIAAALLCAVVAVAPTVAASLASRLTVETDDLLPHSAMARSRSTTVSVEGLPEERAAVRTALDDLDWPVRSVGLKVVVCADEDLPPDAAATYDPNERVIRISERVVAAPVAQGLSHVLAHEIGHAVDGDYLDESERAEFSEIRGHDARQSWDGSGVAWEDSPREDFAEVYAVLVAPSSRVPIQTNAGRIEDVEGMKELVRRYQQGMPDTSGPARELTLLQMTRTLARDYSSQPYALLLILVIAAVCSTTEAVRWMRLKRSGPGGVPHARIALRIWCPICCPNTW